MLSVDAYSCVYVHLQSLCSLVLPCTVCSLMMYVCSLNMPVPSLVVQLLFHVGRGLVHMCRPQLHGSHVVYMLTSHWAFVLSVCSTSCVYLALPRTLSGKPLLMLIIFLYLSIEQLLGVWRVEPDICNKPVLKTSDQFLADRPVVAEPYPLALVSLYQCCSTWSRPSSLQYCSLWWKCFTCHLARTHTDAQCSHE